ncbi:MAG TPA: hypothetical protein VLF43_03955, partial [Candidatus Saccharimonadales bacterium]|nr:hypothetical protein [Candidatus Saccharimonadales bacterium]
PTYSEPTGEATDTAPFDYLPAEQAATSETIKHTELVLPAVVDTLEYSEPDARLAIDESEALSVTDQLVAEEDITKIIERAAEPTELAPTESASVQWTEVLIEEPSKIYQDFTEALHQVITAPPEEQPVTGEDNTIPPIVVIVAQRIAELEPAETEAVMPAVQNIVAALATLRSLQETALTPKAAEAQCELLVIELLETLAVKYAPEDAQQFTRLITRPDFTPLLQGHHTAKPTDLLHQGTHEAKQLLLQLDNGLAGLEYELRYMLGSFALFCSSDLPVNAYELAA